MITVAEKVHLFIIRSAIRFRWCAAIKQGVSTVNSIWVGSFASRPPSYAANADSLTAAAARFPYLCR